MARSKKTIYPLLAMLAVIAIVLSVCFVAAGGAVKYSFLFHNTSSVIHRRSAPAFDLRR